MEGYWERVATKTLRPDDPKPGYRGGRAPWHSHLSDEELLRQFPHAFDGENNDDDEPNEPDDDDTKPESS